VEASHREALSELDRLRLEVAELRASRERLVRRADEDRRRIERDLHDGVRQHLVALAVNLELASSLVDADSAAAKELLEVMAHDVQQALDETAQLAQRIYPSLFDARGLAAALRAAAASARVAVSVDVALPETYPTELAASIYLCWLDALEHAGADAEAAISVRDEERVEFAISGQQVDAQLEYLRDRVEALGGRLTIESRRISGSLPLLRWR
jgi:signal transduction histidine kinase